MVGGRPDDRRRLIGLRSEEHQADHGRGLHNAGAPVMRRNHVVEATAIASEWPMGDQIDYRTGRAADVLAGVTGPVDMIHDDAWFARPPDHLESAIALLRPGGVLTMANWFLLVDALTGEPRNDWQRFAGPRWATDTVAFARDLSERTDVEVNWIADPPIAILTKR